LPTIFFPNYFAKERQRPCFSTFPGFFENPSRALLGSARFSRDQIQNPHLNDYTRYQEGQYISKKTESKLLPRNADVPVGTTTPAKIDFAAPHHPVIQAKNLNRMKF
jgi:hypothetical protein